MEFSRIRKSNQRVGMLPMINIIFLLLIFFMVAGTIEGVDIFEVNLPESANGGEQYSKNSVVYLAEDGRIAVNNDIVDKSNLKTIISTIFIDDPKQKIIIKSDSSIEASKLIWVMNIIEEAGGKEITIATKESGA